MIVVPAKRTWVNLGFDESLSLWSKRIQMLKLKSIALIYVLYSTTIVIDRSIIET
jgi:hypothetical protein